MWAMRVPCVVAVFAGWTFAGGSCGVPSSPGALSDAPGTIDSGEIGTLLGSRGDGATSPSVFDAASGADAAVTWVRVANWSPDSPSVDFCVASQATGAFKGPLVAALDAGAAEAGTTRLGFPLVSAYFSIPAGSYDVRVVAAGAPSCAVGILPDTTNLPTFGVQTFATVALLGEEMPSGTDPGLQVVSFEDSTTSSGSGAALRFINAAPAIPAADFGEGSLSGSGGGFVTLFSGVFFAAASSAQDASRAANQSSADASSDASVPVDANGYYLDLTLADTTVSAHDTRAGTDAALASVSAAAGSVLTVALVGGTSSGISPQLLECLDGAPPDGALSNCAVLH